MSNAKEVATAVGLFAALVVAAVGLVVGGVALKDFYTGMMSEGAASFLAVASIWAAAVAAALITVDRRYR